MPEQWITSVTFPIMNLDSSASARRFPPIKYMVNGYNRGIGQKGYRLGNPESIAMSNDFFRPIAGVYGVMELQPGQVNWGAVNSQPLPGAVHLWLWHVFAGGGRLACTYRFRAPLYGYEQYHYGIVVMTGLPTPAD
jgi:beta-galactosidase